MSYHHQTNLLLKQHIIGYQARQISKNGIQTQNYNKFYYLLYVCLFIIINKLKQNTLVVYMRAFAVIKPQPVLYQHKNVRFQQQLKPEVTIDKIAIPGPPKMKPHVISRTPYKQQVHVIPMHVRSKTADPKNINNQSNNNSSPATNRKTSERKPIFVHKSQNSQHELQSSQIKKQQSSIKSVHLPIEIFDSPIGYGRKRIFSTNNKLHHQQLAYEEKLPVYPRLKLIKGVQCQIEGQKQPGNSLNQSSHKSQQNGGSSTYKEPKLQIKKVYDLQISKKLQNLQDGIQQFRKQLYKNDQANKSKIQSQNGSKTVKKSQQPNNRMSNDLNNVNDGQHTKQKNAHQNKEQIIESNPFNRFEQSRISKESSQIQNSSIRPKSQIQSNINKENPQLYNTINKKPSEENTLSRIYVEQDASLKSERRQEKNNDSKLVIKLKPKSSKISLQNSQKSQKSDCWPLVLTKQKVQINVIRINQISPFNV